MARFLARTYTREQTGDTKSFPRLTWKNTIISNIFWYDSRLLPSLTSSPPLHSHNFIASLHIEDESSLHVFLANFGQLLSYIHICVLNHHPSVKSRPPVYFFRAYSFVANVYVYFFNAIVHKMSPVQGPKDWLYVPKSYIMKICQTFCFCV